MKKLDQRLLTMSAAELDAAAEEAQRSAWESYQRSGMDGWRSQQASSTMARLYKQQAHFARNGGCAAFPGLYDGSRRVRACWVTTDYGNAWLLDETEQAHYGRKYVPVDNSHITADQAARWHFNNLSRSRVQKTLGLVQRWELQRAVAVIQDDGLGIGWKRVGSWWGDDAVGLAPDKWDNWA